MTRRHGIGAVGKPWAAVVVLLAGLAGWGQNIAMGAVADLLPTPKSITVAEGQMPLTAENRIVATDASLEPLAAIFSDEVRLITNLKLAVVKGEARPGDIVLKIDPAIRADADIVAVQKKDGKQQVVRTRDFAHTVVVADTAVVTGWDYRAVCEGTATLLQALTVQEGKAALPKMTVKDWPYADYTGTMIDAARQWIPPDCVKFTIEACRFWKVRYIQMHFSDDHAYTFGSKIFPELGNRNKRISEGIIARCYTQEEMRDLEAYAVARGVTIVPELETPGHSGAMARSRPDIFKGPGCMPMASEKLYDALDKLVGEMCGIFQASPYFHIGCDEAATNFVGRTPAEKEYMKNHTLPGDTHPLQDAWQIYVMHVVRMKEMCRKYGKIAIAWEGLATDKRFKDDLIVMTWYSSQFAREMESQGYNVITVPWFTGPINTWNIFYANDHIYQRTTNVLGAQRPMWQMSEYSMLLYYVPGLCERQERTWGPDNAWGEVPQYRAKLARTTDRMFQVAAPVKVVTEGGKLLGVSDGLKGWNSFSGTLSVKLVAPFPTGGTIRYTLDGTDPTPQSPAYTGPLTMAKTFVLNAAVFDGAGMLGSCNRVKYVWQDIGGYITEYQVAGPYDKDNQPGAQLINIPFEPETTGKGEWKLWKGQGATPGVCPFEGIAGNNRCGYLRAQFSSPKAQPGQLVFSGKEHMKAWLNGQPVYANSGEKTGPEKPGMVRVMLQAGWNQLLVKVAQNGKTWRASARVLAADGTELDGVQFKAE
ncbi:MAG: family 20 glycosylhydrolase [Planctomycetota bacterium]|nr:family 20 glycosylhydrolase [Planctomycetota bacterium]